MTGRRLLPILPAFLWISLCEFLRNQVVLASVWQDHYRRLGLSFPAAPVNGAVWALWAAVFAGAVFVVSTRFDLVETIGLMWVVGFVLMWLVIGNMSVLPTAILWLAVPWSLLEVAGAAWVIRRLRVDA